MSKLKLPPLEGPEKSEKKIRPRLVRVALILLLVGLGFRFWREWQLVHAEMGQLPSQFLTADCGVVLTGSVGRVREGFDLLEQGQVQKLIISGVHSLNSIHDLLPIWPYYAKATEEFVFLEKRSETTYGNAIQSAQYAQALKCRDVVLITSELHMFRSYQTFRQIYPEMIQLIKHPVLAPRNHFGVFDSTLEVIKSLFYRPWAY